MSNIFFRFKQFTVFQDKCAMKVGTDGVLLGSWVNVQKSNRILDIGTGTGLIALMLAQRNADAVIDAIDIDEHCILQAHQNVSQSPFTHQIDVKKESFQEFAATTHNQYNLIVSNPPYFQNALKSPCRSRNFARHDNTLSFFEIISKGANLLKEDGQIALILPHDLKQQLVEQVAKANLFVTRITNVFPLSHKPAKRLLVEMGRKEVKIIEDNLVIEVSRHQYTAGFKILTKQFYLEK